MKKISILLLAVALASCCVMAQQNVFRWGVTAGGNITHADGAGTGFMHSGWDFDGSGGYFLGVSARVALPLSGLGLDASFLYSQEMVDMRTAGQIYTDKLRYFTLPLHARFDFEVVGLSRLVVPYVFAGPQVCFALNDFDWYSLMRRDPLSSSVIHELEDNVTSRRIWKFDLGFGLVLLTHVQVFYTYNIPLESSFRIKTAYDDARTHFSMGTHRIGMTYYF